MEKMEKGDVVIRIMTRIPHPNHIKNMALDMSHKVIFTWFDSIFHVNINLTVEEEIRLGVLQSSTSSILLENILKRKNDD